MSDGTEPIADEEVLYRRIPVNPEYYNPTISSNPAQLAFKPRKDDATGLSISRAKYQTPEEVAANTSGKSYYIAVLIAGNLRKHGIEVKPMPKLPDDLGHAEIPMLTYQDRKTNRCKEATLKLARLLSESVIGPFPTTSNT